MRLSPWRTAERCVFMQNCKDRVIKSLFVSWIKGAASRLSDFLSLENPFIVQKKKEQVLASWSVTGSLKRTVDS
ncbi:hypothetical protein D3C86_1837330 [compost metagenome]